MKKILLTLFLIVSCVFVSCSFNETSIKKGELSFSVPVEQLANIAARDVGNGKLNPRMDFLVIAQIKGSKGYYEKQIQSVTVAYADFEKDIQNYPEGKNATPLYTSDVAFSFENLSAKQTYTVMVDIAVAAIDMSENSTEVNYSHTYTGIQNDVKVVAGNTKAVAVDLKERNSNEKDYNFCYKITYKTSAGAVKTVDTPYGDIYFDEYSGETPAVSFTRKSGQIYYSAKSGESGIVTSMKLAFAQNYNLANCVEAYVYNYDGMGNEKPLIGKLNNGELELINEIKKAGSSFSPAVQMKLDNYLFYLEYYNFNMPAAVVSNTYTFNLISDQFKEAEETLPANPNRYNIAIPLSDIMGGETVEAGKTLVFVITGLEYNGNIEDIQQHTYIEEINYRFSDIDYTDEHYNPEERYKDLTTVKVYKEGWIESYPDPIIITGNMLNGNERYLNLYFYHDSYIDKGISYVGQIQYVSFAPEERVYAFNSSFDDSNPDNPSYRHEIIVPLRVGNELSGQPIENDTLAVSISGNLEYMALGNDNFGNGIYLQSEFYDRDLNKKIYYHALSQITWTNGEGELVDNEDNYKADYDDDGKIPTFIYAHIAEPITETNDFRFQCYNEVGAMEIDNNGEPKIIPVPIDRVLYIRNFGISTELISGN